MGVKLVRGAYMHQERQYASDHSLLDPIHPTASATHTAYDSAALSLHQKRTPVIFATHNWSSIQKALDNPNAGFAQLYGMGDWMTIEIARRGIPSYKYVPFGTVSETVNPSHWSSSRSLHRISLQSIPAARLLITKVTLFCSGSLSSPSRPRKQQHPRRSWNRSPLSQRSNQRTLLTTIQSQKFGET